MFNKCSKLNYINECIHINVNWFILFKSSKHSKKKNIKTNIILIIINKKRYLYISYKENFENVFKYTNEY